MSSAIKNIGWIGTGVMGKSMVKHLMEGGFTLSVYNRTKSKTDELVAMGAKYCEPEEMAPNVDALIIMVGFPQDLRSLLLDRKILNACKPGSLLIDHTTSSPGLAVEIAERAQALGIDCLDAPVSGGDVGAKAGTLSIMTGGTLTAFNRAAPIFACYGKTVKLLGKAGSGQHTKAANQVAIAGCMIGVCESLMYGQAAGLDLKQMCETIGGGAAGSFSLTAYGPRILKGDMAPGFFVEHFVKDMEIVLDESRRLGICLPGLALVHQMYRGLMANGGEKNGTQALIQVLEQLNNTKIKKYDF